MGGGKLKPIFTPLVQCSVVCSKCSDANFWRRGGHLLREYRGTRGSLLFIPIVAIVAIVASPRDAQLIGPGRPCSMSPTPAFDGLTSWGEAHSLLCSVFTSSCTTSNVPPHLAVGTAHWAPGIFSACPARFDRGAGLEITTGI